MSKFTVLLDVDDTILDIDLVKKFIGSTIEANYGQGTHKKFWEIYEEVRSEKGYVDSKRIATKFAKTVNSENLASAISAFQEVPFQDYLLPSAKKLVAFLSKNSRLIIFSDGDQLFQKTKIKKLGLDKLSKEIIVSRSKKDLFPNVIKNYPGPFVIIDDKPEIILAAKKYLPGSTRIWIEFGKYAQSSNRVNADLKTSDLNDVIIYLKQLFKRQNSGFKLIL